MPFEVVGRLGLRIRQVVGVETGDHPMGRGNFGVDVEHLIVTNRDFVV